MSEAPTVDSGTSPGVLLEVSAGPADEAPDDTLTDRAARYPKQPARSVAARNESNRRAEIRLPNLRPLAVMLSSP
jgi:hypothetical protein